MLKRSRNFAYHGNSNADEGRSPLRKSTSYKEWKQSAEFFALCHLVAWHNKVQRVYAPGLQVQDPL